MNKIIKSFCALAYNPQQKREFDIVDKEGMLHLAKLLANREPMPRITDYSSDIPTESVKDPKTTTSYTLRQ